jgi:hypothetical protein
MNPGFSERTYEFCFNAEYCQTNAALLASHPHIPSQQMEKDLGYDVEFRLQHGIYTRSIFFQHKVSAFAENKSGRNGHFFDAHGGPYFRFPVDNDQHNTLCELSRTKGNAFYCAPRFHLSHQLELHFRAGSIAPNAILLDPVDVGDIFDNDRHNITYSPNGSNPTLHSEIRRFKKFYTGGEEDGPFLKQREINEDYIEELSKELILRTKESRFEKAITRAVESSRPIERVQYLLGRVYQVSWLLLP